MSDRAYDPTQGTQNLRRFAQAPLRLSPGSRVTLYEQDGIVAYYTLTKEPAEVAVETIRVELEAQQAKLAEVETLRTALDETRTLVIQRDEKIASLSSQFHTLEQKHESLEAAAAPAKIAAMESELVELRAFRAEVDRFMKRSEE